MDRALFKSHAKINLSLDITGVRSDGYHELSTIMTEIPLWDEINIKKTAEGICLTCPPWLPSGSDNLAYRAAELFFAETGISGGAAIELKKNIPAGAGLGGGSSNAAAVINGLDRLYETSLSIQKRREMAARLGADVPFFITGGTALCEGIGERITPLSRGLENCFLVLCKPEKGLLTGEVYAAYDRVGAGSSTDTRTMLKALETGDIAAIAAGAANALEGAALTLLPEVGEIKSAMLTHGSLGACMSGSGSAVFGIFAGQAAAAACGRELRQRFDLVFELSL